MKILFLTPRDSGKNLGGVEGHVRLLTEELERRGHRVKELSLDIAKIAKNSENREPEVSKRETPCHTARSHPFFAFKFRAWGYLWNRRELLRRADIIHVHDVFWWVAPLALVTKIAKISEKHEPRVFVTFHGWEGRCPPTRSAVWQKRLAAWLSDGTIGVGNFFEKWYGVKTDRVVWGGLDKGYKNYKDYKSFKESPCHTARRHLKRRSHPVFAFFGRLEEVNGIRIVIKAIKSIRGHKVRPRSTSGSDLSIVFVGDGAWRARAESVGEVTGMVDEPWKFLAEAEVVIASSYLAILEAAAMGKRIIAVANNPLKRDYLESHPLRDNIKIVETVEELVGEIMELGTIRTRPEERLVGGFGRVSGFLQSKNPGPSEKEARRWALGQTAEKLADEYEKLWRIRGEG